MGVPLMGVYLVSVDLIGVSLMGVYLTGMYLMGVHLIGVYLVSVCLMSVCLMNVHLIVTFSGCWRCLILALSGRYHVRLSGCLANRRSGLAIMDEIDELWVSLRHCL